MKKRLGAFMGERVSQIQLAVSFLRVGAVAFGGGYAVLPLLDRELNQRRRWVSSDQIADLYAIGQTIPGPIIVNVSALLGYQMRGRPGALVSGILVTLPSFLAICLLFLFWNLIQSWPGAEGILRGLTPAVAALILSAGIKMARRFITTPVALILTVTALILVFGEFLNPAYLIFSGISFGLILGLTVPLQTLKALRRSQ